MSEPLPQMRAITFIQVSVKAAQVLSQEQIYETLDRFRLGRWGDMNPIASAYNEACLRALAPIAIPFSVGAWTVIAYADFRGGTARIGISPEDVGPEAISITIL